MATNTVSIDVVANDLASAALRIVQEKLESVGGTAAVVASSAIGLGVAVVGSLKAAADAAQAYDQQVKELMLRTGGTAEETSRLIQTVDDAGISYEVLSTAMKFAVKNGIEPNIQSIATLSDEYLALKTPVEKGQFLLEKFGKSGMDMARIMDKGGDAIIQMSQAINKNLVVTDEAIRQSEEFRIKIDNLSDSWEGLYITVGNEAIPVFSDLLAITNSNITATSEFGDLFTDLDNIMKVTTPGADRAGAALKLIADAAADIINSNLPSFMQESGASISTATAGYIEMAKAAQAAALGIAESTAATDAALVSNASTLDLIMNLQNATDKYRDSQKSLTTKSRELKDELALLGDRTNKNADEWDGVTQKIKDNEQAMRDLEAQHQQSMARIAVDLYVAQLKAGDFTDAELDMALQAYESAGIIDSATVDMAKSIKDNIEAEAIRAKDEVKQIGVVAEGLARDYAMNFFANLTLSWDEAGGGGNGVCFTANTLIAMADGTHKRIKDVTLFDKVLSFHDGRTIGVSIAKVFHHPAGYADKLIIINGNIETTPPHPFWIDGKWVDAGDIKIGDKLTTISGGLCEVFSLSTVATDKPVYNLHTAHESHNYYANGILVHNAQEGGGTGTGGGGGGGGSQCFTGDTIILLAGGEYKNIRDMRVGDAVISWHNGERVVANVEDVICHPAGQADRLVIINNKVRVTPEHLLFVNGAWLAARDVKIGDMLTGTHGEVIPVLSVRDTDTDEAVYNIHTDHTSHNYFADGILAHNAKEGDDFAGFTTSRGGGITSGGGATNVYLTYSPLLSTSNRDEMQNVLLPFILEGIRQAQLR